MYLFPVIGKIPLKDIEAPMLFNLIESIQDLGYLEAGKRVNSCCSMIFRHGVAKGYCSRDITQDYRGMLKNGKTKHMPSLTDEDEISQLLQDMDKYNGTIVVKSALIISAYIFVRPSELANSKWSYIDFEKFDL
jgi:integrase